MRLSELDCATIHSCSMSDIAALTRPTARGSLHRKAILLSRRKRLRPMPARGAKDRKSPSMLTSTASFIWLTAATSGSGESGGQLLTEQDNFMARVDQHTPNGIRNAMIDKEFDDPPPLGGRASLPLVA